jgi:hypothetical protein
MKDFNGLNDTEQDQIFAEHFHRLRNVVKLPRRNDDNPVASKPFAARGSGTDVRNLGERNPYDFHSLSSVRTPRFPARLSQPNA